MIWNLHALITSYTNTRINLDFFVDQIVWKALTFIKGCITPNLTWKKLFSKPVSTEMNSTLQITK